MSGMRLWVLAAILAAGRETTATAEGKTVIVDGVLGPAYLSNARSHTVSHLFKPIVRLDAGVGMLERLEVGGALLGVASASEHYRVLGVLGRTRYAALRRGAFTLGPSAALGAGYDADILHGDLAADAKIAPYWLLGIDARWVVSGVWLMGIDASWQNGSLLTLGLMAGCRLGGSRQ
jgi:hypothetical protein